MSSRRRGRKPEHSWRSEYPASSSIARRVASTIRSYGASADRREDRDQASRPVTTLRSSPCDESFRPTVVRASTGSPNSTRISRFGLPSSTPATKSSRSSRCTVVVASSSLYRFNDRLDRFLEFHELLAFGDERSDLAVDLADDGIRWRSHRQFALHRLDYDELRASMCERLLNAQPDQLRPCRRLYSSL